MRYLVLLLTSFYTITGLASEVGYEVEVIVFKNNNVAYQNTENWRLLSKTSEVTEDDESSAVAKNTPVTIDNNKKPVIKMLGPDKFQLTDLASRIQVSSDYTLLYHNVWAQPGLDEQHAINFHTLIPYSVDQQESSDKGQLSIDTNFKLIMSRYLHFNVDMLIPYTVETVAPEKLVEGTSAPGQETYVEFTDTRRMRSREIHYIDHPLIGIIIQAIPFKMNNGKGKTGASGTYQTL